MGVVQCEGFAREQVSRNGIAGESVKNHNVERLPRFALHHQAPIAFDHLHLARALAQEAEFGIGDRDHRGVQFIEMVHVAGPRVGGEGARAEPDHADA